MGRPVREREKRIPEQVRVINREAYGSNPTPRCSKPISGEDPSLFRARSRRAYVCLTSPSADRNIEALLSAGNLLGERNSLVNRSASRYPKLAFPGEAGKVGFFKASWIVVEKIVDAEAMMAFGRQFIRQMRSDKSGNPRHE